MITANLYPWIPNDVPKARAYMQYNLAVCYATRGEFDKAMATLALVCYILLTLDFIDLVTVEISRVRKPKL